jgi:hypothetical protein
MRIKDTCNTEIGKCHRAKILESMVMMMMKNSTRTGPYDSFTRESSTLVHWGNFILLLDYTLPSVRV